MYENKNECQNLQAFSEEEEEIGNLEIFQDEEEKDFSLEDKDEENLSEKNDMNQVDKENVKKNKLFIQGNKIRKYLILYNNRIICE